MTYLLGSLVLTLEELATDSVNVKPLTNGLIFPICYVFLKNSSSLFSMIFFILAIYWLKELNIILLLGLIASWRVKLDSMALLITIDISMQLSFCSKYWFRILITACVSWLITLDCLEILLSMESLLLLSAFFFSYFISSWLYLFKSYWNDLISFSYYSIAFIIPWSL